MYTVILWKQKPVPPSFLCHRAQQRLLFVALPTQPWGCHLTPQMLLYTKNPPPHLNFWPSLGYLLEAYLGQTPVCHCDVVG